MVRRAHTHGSNSNCKNGMFLHTLVLWPNWLSSLASASPWGGLCNPQPWDKPRCPVSLRPAREESLTETAEGSSFYHWRSSTRAHWPAPHIVGLGQSLPRHLTLGSPRGHSHPALLNRPGTDHRVRGRECGVIGWKASSQGIRTRLSWGNLHFHKNKTVRRTDGENEQRQSMNFLCNCTWNST